MIAVRDPDFIVCSVCGARNEARRQRCSACGAKLQDADDASLHNGSSTGHKPAEDIAWRWVFTAALAYGLAELVLLVLLPMMAKNYDPQGMAGLLLVVSLWAAGGVLFGSLAPAKTYFEPAIGAIFTALPCMAYLMHISDVYELSPLAYLVGSMLGAMGTVLGAVLGETLNRRRRASAGHPARN